MDTENRKIRCAIYTRKSVEEGLEQEFNSLDAQRESAENYIASQRGKNWICLPEHYDDGGFTGGNTNRPALQKLLKDIEAGGIDVVVVYKIDRLSRSICDFAELSKTFDKYGTSFVSVTQDINTSTSSGRMMLNILVTFAQYEREVIAERIHDKMSASRRKGMWTGGFVPFGYRTENKKLIVVPEEAEIVRKVFQRYYECGSTKVICAELSGTGIKNHNGREFSRGAISNMLGNHVYIGQVNYKGEIYEGEQDAIIDTGLWNAIHALDKKEPINRQVDSMACLKGILKCGHCGCAMIPTYTAKNGRHYIYYICGKDVKRGISKCPIQRVSGGDIERLILKRLKTVFTSQTFTDLTAQSGGLDRGSVAEVFSSIESFWDELFPAERNRLLRLLLESVTINEYAIDIVVKTDGMKGLANEIINGFN